MLKCKSFVCLKPIYLSGSQKLGESVQKGLTNYIAEVALINEILFVSHMVFFCESGGATVSERGAYGMRNNIMALNEF